MSYDDPFRAILRVGALALAGGLVAPALAGESATAATDGQQLLRTHCQACHTADNPSDALTRIGEQRKSPEGWHMTLNRMEHLRGVQIPPEDKRALIRYLADTQGLAPSEAAAHRYLLEQDTNLVEDVSEPYAEMCARCHSAARFKLQRRSEEEWNLLIHFHVGQYPTLELHALSRDRPWWQLAMTETVPQLARDLPLESAAWRDWLAAPKPELAGEWVVLGYVPGKGEFDARMRASVNGVDRFDVTLEGSYADGTALRGEGTANVYTGYEWRAALQINGQRMRQVMAAAADGNEMIGRQFLRDAQPIGGTLRALRVDTTSRIVAVRPAHLRRGETGTITIIGNALDGTVSLGEGVEVLETIAQSADRITVTARANGDVGLRSVAVGTARATDMLAVSEQVARLEVQPADAVARVGGPGDAQMEKVRVAYRAVAWGTDADGTQEIPLGHVPVQWSIEPLDEEAAAAEDHRHAGSIDADGIFTPGDAGPNPARHMSAGNTGRLHVVATLDDGSESVEGRGNLLVAVPDFVHRVLD